MRFLVLGFRRPSSAVKPQHRPVRIDAPAMPVIKASTIADEAADVAIEDLLRELGEDPFDVWARLCAPVPSSDREPSMRRVVKRRAALRRRVGARG